MTDGIGKRFSDSWAVLGTLTRSGLIAPLRPDKYLQMAAALRRERLSLSVGFALAAARCPNRPALVDELGTLTWRELERRCAALAAAWQALPGGAPGTVGIMCRNHRGFVESVVAANRIGANALLLNTSFAAPALAEVLRREDVTALIYDDEFTPVVERALDQRPDITRVVAWTDDPHLPDITVEAMIGAYLAARPKPPPREGRFILLTSGTTGPPKGARLGRGGPLELKAILDRTPWRAEEATVVAAPMFHAWGFSQLIFSAMMSCTVVTRRRFDAEATLQLIDRHRATGLAVVPVMFDRIMELPDEIRGKYTLSTLRFASASGSRMRPDVAIGFMNEFGDVIYSNYNATEAGMIATATPQDLREAPATAGRPAEGTEIRILGPDVDDLPTGVTGTIYVRNSTGFDGYTSGDGKHFHDGYMSSGDIGYLDEAGRLFVVGRDDEMIVSGGENVYPIEVETVLAGQADVVEVSVIGVDDEQYGQRLAAFVAVRKGGSVTSQTLKEMVRGNLANYKVPREIYFLDELPRNSTGKIDRKELRARTVAGHLSAPDSPT